MLWIGLALLCAGCSPVTSPPGTSAPDGDAAEWEMTATLRLTQARDEIHVQLHLVPHLNYSPLFSITGPVGSETIINFHIEQEGVFRYNADIHRSGDHVGGALWVTDLDDTPIWTVFCIEVDR